MIGLRIRTTSFKGRDQRDSGGGLGLGLGRELRLRFWSAGFERRSVLVMELGGELDWGGEGFAPDCFIGVWDAGCWRAGSAVGRYLGRLFVRGVGLTYLGAWFEIQDSKQCDQWLCLKQKQAS